MLHHPLHALARTAARIAACACLSLASVGGAQAGSFEQTGDMYDPCTFTFRGEIMPGDARKLADLDNPAWSEGTGATLCFDSPGGSLLEGQKMFSTIFYDKNYRTHVRKGDECLSACAIAWLGGSFTVGTGQFTFPSRTIEPGARLGFHAPALDLPERRTYTDAQVEQGFAIALEAARGLFQIYNTEIDGVDPLNGYLYEAILATPPERFFEINTSERAALAGVDVVGVAGQIRLNDNAVRDACILARMAYRDNGLRDAAALAEELQWARDDIDSMRDEGIRPVVTSDRYRIVRAIDFRYTQETLCLLSMDREEWPDDLSTVTARFVDVRAGLSNRDVIREVVEQANQDGPKITLPAAALLPVGTRLATVR